jgi:sirohydrochlorin ferrochelatase
LNDHFLSGDTKVKPMSEPCTAALLIAHGSRKPEANADLVALAEAVRERGKLEIVEIAYLELASPSIPEGAQACVSRQATRVLMMPYFLSAGSHVVEDLGRFRDQFQTEYPNVEFAVCPPLGLHPLIVDVVFDRIVEGEQSLDSESNS